MYCQHCQDALMVASLSFSCCSSSCSCILSCPSELVLISWPLNVAEESMKLHKQIQVARKIFPGPVQFTGLQVIALCGASSKYMAKGDKHVSYDLSVAPPIAKAPFGAPFPVRSCWEERGSYSSALFLPRTSLRKKPQKEIWTCEPLWKLVIHVWGSLEKGVRLKGTKLAERPSKPSICFWQTCKLSVNSSLSFSNCCTFSSSSGIWWSLWSWPIALKTTSPGGVPFLFFCIKHQFCYHSNLNFTRNVPQTACRHLHAFHRKLEPNQKLPSVSLSNGIWKHIWHLTIWIKWIPA